MVKKTGEAQRRKPASGSLVGRGDVGDQQSKAAVRTITGDRRRREGESRRKRAGVDESSTEDLVVWVLTSQSAQDRVAISAEAFDFD